MKNNKKVVYISLPMAMHEDTIWKRYNEGIEYIRNQKGYEDCEIIGPCDIEEFKHSNKHEYQETYGYYISKDIKTLVDNATDILLCLGWQNSKGCRIEHETSKIMNINRIYMRNYTM